MKDNKPSKKLDIFLLLLLAILCAFKFSGPALLRAYIQAGIGDCLKSPILCTVPGKIFKPSLNREYTLSLIPYDFPEIKISVPKGYTVVNETIKKIYYKKKKRPFDSDVMFVLRQKPNFFPGLFPQLKNQGINDNAAFIDRLMYANLKNIRDLTDAFFVITKSIFTPNLGECQKLTMIKVTFNNMYGYITYSPGEKCNFFDCNILTDSGNLFKVYIRDKSGRLDLEKVCSILSTVSLKNPS